MPRIQDDAGGLISQFFKLYADYINIYNILPDNIWNLDEAGFKIGDSTKNIQYLVPNNRPTVISRDTSELVTVLEMISRTGKVGKPFSIYKGVHQMENWFPSVITEEYDCATSPSGFINETIFYEWVSDLIFLHLKTNGHSYRWMGICPTHQTELSSHLSARRSFLYTFLLI